METVEQETPEKVCVVARITPYVQAIQSSNTEKGAIMREQGAWEEEPNSCSTGGGSGWFSPPYRGPWSCGLSQTLYDLEQGLRQGSEAATINELTDQSKRIFC